MKMKWIEKIAIVFMAALALIVSYGMYYAQAADIRTATVSYNIRSRANFNRYVVYDAGPE
jgi:hypothetical protein